EDGIRDRNVTGVQTCALPIYPHPREPAAELYGGIASTLDALHSEAAGGPDRSEWLSSLREAEDEKRAGEEAELNDSRSPLHPMRSEERRVGEECESRGAWRGW